jgi:hypothetical protein
MNMNAFWKIGVLLLLTSSLMTACKDKLIIKNLANVPVYMAYDEFRSLVRFEAARPIKKGGNIYLKDNYLLVVEENEGIHFIDNSNPSAPQNKGFMRIPNCTGVSVKDQYLYANSAIDLVVIDISSWNQPIEVARMNNVFPAVLPQHNPNYPMASIDLEKGVVVAWELKETKQKVEYYPVYYFGAELMNVVGGFGSNGGPSSGTGFSGSITKFSIINNHLYVMEGFQLYPINIANPLNPQAANPVSIWRTVETLFAYNNHLFMGTTTGMLIFSVANPNEPNQIGVINHAQACDPVVVKDNYAYVTIRSGNICGQNINQLDIIDISNLSNPVLMETFQMVNPHGLGVDNNLLFICDGSAGLKVFDATNPLTVGNHLLHQFGNITAIDIIPFNNVAIMISSDAITQYDYSNTAQIQFLSKITFQP